MRIEVTDPTGIKSENYGHMQTGEVRIVDDVFGQLAVKNGWARHLPADGEEEVSVGERGSQDGPLEVIQPDKGRLRAKSK